MHTVVLAYWLVPVAAPSGPFSPHPAAGRCTTHTGRQCACRHSNALLCAWVGQLNRSAAMVPACLSPCLVRWRECFKRNRRMVTTDPEHSSKQRGRWQARGGLTLRPRFFMFQSSYLRQQK